MKLHDFYYEFPKELIAQAPLKTRDNARLLVLDRKKNEISEIIFKDLAQYFSAGDCLVLNDTKVLPVRLYGHRKTGGRVEIFLLDMPGKKCKALVNPSARIKDGEKITLESGINAVILERTNIGRFLEFDAPIEEVLKTGHVPLPPYIERVDNAFDKESYQTVYAARDGATAAPTAGLHFSGELLEKIKNKGVHIVYVTLHTSYGTFAPVKSENIEEHKMHFEYYEMKEETARIINNVKKTGGKIFGVGTTSCRVLETSAGQDGFVKQGSGETNLFIYPGYEFKTVDSLITNFHLPSSTLLMLVSALAGRDFIMTAYKRAIDLRFRFFSYGDAMLIL
ncbi:S-adenosylmethionine:tRNA ribosyltransferase-isomerase [Candidatus Omnitrophus magneticus]|uniref:S-adenosylmethionine:tRNA ribosyltransferase-isomerase n=1 Tax=Candidatus Omnitrophus magneticus TaxID=1609969 RepID=A0A0F0CJJ0_9BACT|nr:S-adenosylmethionine:tRNA ribosyltransferase-isomerase [Candidatus Omnitrophus magneticus]